MSDLMKLIRFLAAVYGAYIAVTAVWNAAADL